MNEKVGNVQFLPARISRVFSGGRAGRPAEGGVVGQVEVSQPLRGQRGRSEVVGVPGPVGGEARRVGDGAEVDVVGEGAEEGAAAQVAPVRRGVPVGGGEAGGGGEAEGAPAAVAGGRRGGHHGHLGRGFFRVFTFCGLHSLDLPRCPV